MNIKYGSLLRLAVAVLALGLAACSSPYGWNKVAGHGIDAEMARATQTNARVDTVPTEVNQALLPPLTISLPAGEGKPIEPRFDLTVNSAPARQVFMGLVEGTQYGMMVHPQVDGRISLNLKEVTIPEAMDAIRAVYGYEYKREGNRFFVLPGGLLTRMFAVNYLNLNRKGRSDTRVVSGELTQGDYGANSDSTNSNSRGARSRGNQTAGIRVETESQADFWKELQESVSAIIGNVEGRVVVANPQSGLLVVRALPHELRLVEEFLDLTQVSVNRQVVLEAKILEVELTDRFQTGINWADIGRVGNTTVTTGQVGGGTIFRNGVSEILGQTGTLNPTPGVFDPVSGTLTSAFGGVFTLAVQANSFAAFVEALQTQGRVNVLSSPRVSTVNNQKAVIKVGGDEFFVTGVTNTPNAVAGGGVIYTPTVELTPFFSGIALDVTPSIDAAENIILHIHPAVSQVLEQDKNIRISGADYSLPSALSSIQESDNIVRAANGQIIVIGGLMKEGSTDENASIPLLGDIPIIGNLFKHKRITRIKKELVILLKPTVVDGEFTWSDIVEDSRGRMDAIRRER